MLDFSGTAEITDEGIKKHFKSMEAYESIFELAWNGFDANAKTISIDIILTEMDGTDSIEVLDDGDGIDIDNLKNSFQKFNESTKKFDDDKHGSQGKGRLAFHKLCEKACWYTKRNGYNAKIEIHSQSIKEYRGKYVEATEQHAALSALSSGTCAVLTGFLKNKIPGEEEFAIKLGREFGWYLTLNKDRSIRLNGKIIAIPDHEHHERPIVIDGNDFVLHVIRWHEKPTSEKSYNYLIDKNNKVLIRELSKANNKVTFYTSAYASSPWLENYDPKSLQMDIGHQGHVKIVKELLNVMTSFQREVYDNYLRQFVDNEIDRFDSNGYFPAYAGVDKDYARWRKDNTKDIVRNIYLADPQIFNKLSPKPAKILIRLLDKILVSNENDSLFEVLDGVLDLTSENIDRLANHLKQTTMANIISTIELLQRRHQAIHELREVMTNRYSEVLETPDLQKIIESNTWLFGPQYSTIGAEEDTFTSLAKNWRNQVSDVDLITLKDIEDSTDIEGVNRQVDLFLARKVPTYDSAGNEIYKCIIVEIKRPGISLNKKHLQQIDDYAEILAKHSAFSSAKMYFEILLIGRRISKDDIQIRNRAEGLKDKGEYGLVTYGNKIKCYVKDWFTIFDDFELSNGYLLRTLESKLADLSHIKTEQIVNGLQEVNAGK